LTFTTLVLILITYTISPGMSIKLSHATRCLHDTDSNYSDFDVVFKVDVSNFYK